MDLTQVLVTNFNVDEALTLLLTVTDIDGNESIDYEDTKINNFIFKIIIFKLSRLAEIL